MKTLARKLPLAPISLGSAAKALQRWIMMRRTRIALTRLDPHLLRDVGIDAPAADQEVERPFWS